MVCMGCCWCQYGWVEQLLVEDLEELRSQEQDQILLVFLLALLSIAMGRLSLLPQVVDKLVASSLDHTLVVA